MTLEDRVALLLGRQVIENIALQARLEEMKARMDEMAAQIEKLAPPTPGGTTPGAAGNG